MEEANEDMHSKGCWPLCRVLNKRSSIRKGLIECTHDRAFDLDVMMGVEEVFVGEDKLSELEKKLSGGGVIG